MLKSPSGLEIGKLLWVLHKSSLMSLWNGGRLCVSRFKKSAERQFGEFPVSEINQTNENGKIGILRSVLTIPSVPIVVAVMTG